MQVTDELIYKLHNLAALEVTPETLPQIRVDLERMLDFVEKINEVDVSQVEPLIHLSTEVNRLRPDEPQPSLAHEAALHNAPKRDSDFFRVPKVMDKG